MKKYRIDAVYDGEPFDRFTFHSDDDPNKLARMISIGSMSGSVRLNISCDEEDYIPPPVVLRKVEEAI